MHPSIHRQAHPDKPAIIMSGSGLRVSYRGLDERSNQSAHLFRSLGLRPGDTIAFSLGNMPELFEIAWGAQRSGLFFVAMSDKLQDEEIAYILQDSNARVFIASGAGSDASKRLRGRLPEVRYFSIDRDRNDIAGFLEERGRFPVTPVTDEEAGVEMLYSSGTTGRPKGIKPSLTRGQPITIEDSVTMVTAVMYAGNRDTVYLCPAPAYHAAPFAIAWQSCGWAAPSF